MAKASQLPTTLSLFIATSGAVRAHSESSFKPLFECAADGIVNARPASDNSGLVAVADSQLVILHDAARGTDRNYRLKSGQGEPRLLLFSPDSSTLYFSTTLSAAIQAYDIPTGDLLPPPHIHPSPPNVLAMSSDGHILLSASPSPPTIYIQDLRLVTTAYENLHPLDVSSPAVFAAFRTEGKSVAECPVTLVIGFRDGTLSLFKMIRSVRQASHCNISVNSSSTRAYRPARVASIRQLHKVAMGGIKAAEFLPGYRSRVVSIGHDGRCRLVDFEGGGRVLRTWYVSGPATCLTVSISEAAKSRHMGAADVFQNEDWAVDEQMYEATQTYIAVGTQAGKVMVYNILGLLVYEVDMRASIVAIAWIGDMTAPSLLSGRRASFSPGSAHEAHRNTATEAVIDSVVEAYEETAPSEDVGTVRKTTPLTRNMPSPVRLDGARDLFCPSPPPLRSILRRSSVITHDAAAQTTQPDCDNARRKSFLRPRIVTETFKAPSSSRPTSPQRSLLPRPIPRMASPANEDQLRRTSQEVYDVFFADALRVGRTPSPADSESVYSQSSQEEQFDTPPASRMPEKSIETRLRSSPPISNHIAGLHRTSSVQAGTKQPAPGFALNFNGGRDWNAPSSTTRSLRKILNDEAFHSSEVHTTRAAYQASRAERSPFSGPSGPGPSRSVDSKSKPDNWPGEYGSATRHARLRQRTSSRARRMGQESHDASGVGNGGRTAQNGGGVARQGHSVEFGQEQEHGHEHDALMQEMAMLREEFRALREAVLAEREREKRA